jgi:GNAT superfamily N-acetyltransferase
MSAGEFDVALAATAWARGWAQTRNKPAPVPQAYGCKIDLGPPEHTARHVVADLNAPMLIELVSGLQAPGTWLKVCAHPDDVIPLLHEEWQVQAPEYLMAAALCDAAAVTPEGYRLSLSTSGTVTDAELRDLDGQLAAKGRVAHSDGFAAFDQIVTEPEHQRRGLGRVIMAALGKISVSQNAKTGVLVATEQGRSLYQAIGWTLVSPVTAAVIV